MHIQIMQYSSFLCVYIYKYMQICNMIDFSSTLCYCTAELLSSRGRPSSVERPSSVKPVSQNPPSILMPDLVESYLFTISPDHFFFFNFVFDNMGPYGRQKLQTTSPLKLYNRLTQNNQCILLRTVSTKIV